MSSATRAAEITRLEAELTKVRTAIAQVYDAQSYSTGAVGLTRERARLDLLTSREAELEAKLERLRRGGGLHVSYVVPR